MKRRVFISALSICLTLVMVLSSCAPQDNKDQSTTYADDIAMSTIASGLEARWLITDASSFDNNDTSQLIKAIKAELDVDSPLRDRSFKDSKLQELVLSYINTLNDSIDVLENYSQNSIEYINKWNIVYSERVALLKTFADEYGLKMSDSEKQDTLEQLLADGKAAQQENAARNAINGLVSEAQFQKNDEGYGTYLYSSVIENTTDYSFSNVGLVIALYDSDGIKAEEAYATTSSWPKGEKVKFEAYARTDASNIKVSVNYYTVD